MGSGNCALAQFKQDSFQLGQDTEDFIKNFYPAYGAANEMAVDSMQADSLAVLNGFTFYKVCECTVYNVEQRFQYFSEKMEKLFTAAFSIKQNVCYGVASYNGKTSLLLGVGPASNNLTIKTLVEGLLPGIRIERFREKFENAKLENGIDKERYGGSISGIPAVKVNGEYKPKDISAFMRSLNGQNYTWMVLCKPISEDVIQEKINAAVQIQDHCFAISKRTVALQQGISNTKMHTGDYHEADGSNWNNSSGINLNGGAPGAAAGAAAGAVVGSVLPGIGTAVGAAGGGLIGLIAGKQISFNKGKSKGGQHSITKGYSDAVSEAISKNESISGEVQNGFAIDLMKMAQSMAERLKIGRSIGMWESVVTYSSDSKFAADIIQGSLYAEIASGQPDILPPVVFSFHDKCVSKKTNAQHLMIPKGFFNGKSDSPVGSIVTSEELSGICMIPSENTVGFAIHEAKPFALDASVGKRDRIIGKLCEYQRVLENVPFGLSGSDLNKHLFVCGMTGYGKTNTIKKILSVFDKPYLVIEPAKKEYRNSRTDPAPEVYTFGRPEINCIRINPFYVIPGTSPQQHIDLLKDLFSASFAFYGPMPYIFEKCLNNVYIKRGWNLTLGFHPMLINRKNKEEFFRADKIREKYSTQAHKYVFPTMQDLKDEIDFYIENELSYEGEVKGNIRSAIKSRIDSLCIGAKGYMFNSNEAPDFDDLFNHNCVVELEGLADDGDKAFALGLLLIFINEYRQMCRETREGKGLEHILVIEEAHRLLKNVSTENNDEIGNPKGKAVEHFTNLLAEMRSYGQGVIVAEQIPGKIAPDVIKNSSNKIVHRIVAKDDQEIIASTIGLNPNDVLSLGNSEAGYALCHKSGMKEPVIVKIAEVESNIITDESLYKKNIEHKLLAINTSMIKNGLPKETDAWAAKFLVTLMYKPTEEIVYRGMECACDELANRIAIANVTLIPKVDKKKSIKKCIIEKAVSLMVSGVFSRKELPDDHIIELMEKIAANAQKKDIVLLHEKLDYFYGRETEGKIIEVLAGLVLKEYVDGYNIDEIIQDFYLVENKELCSKVRAYIREEAGICRY